jgi:Outer membrane receptor proteins, mostly Fe transport
VHTVQDHAKFKLAYDFSPTLRASYVFGYWKNDAERSAQTYLRDAAGNPVYSGNVNIDGERYTLLNTDLSLSRGRLEHFIHGLSLKSNTRGVWDWEVAASVYDYARDEVRSPTQALPAATAGGPGQLTDQGGTGWNTLALKGTWRPGGRQSAHVVDVGFQREHYLLRTLVSGTANWLDGGAGVRISAFNGDTELQSIYAQDTWRFAPDWRTTLGGRIEQWRAFGGSIANASTTQNFGSRDELSFSPKAAIAYQLTPLWALKASLGRAVRNPTVAELYQGSIVAGAIVNNDPNLKPEKSWTSELTAERDLGNGVLRSTLFFEDTRDALYSQLKIDNVGTTSTIQNVDHIRTAGLELAYQASNVWIDGLDFSSSLTFTDSKIIENRNFLASEGKWQPRVPMWRGTFLASYRPNEKWVYSFGARYSGRQYGALDNSDVNGDTYFGVSDYFVTDVRARYKFSKQWSASAGIDNLNNAKYWAFHPYPQRTFQAEIKYDL